MSVITFWIGNGFDLSCGLKSRYTDSYDGYIHSKSSSECIEQFKKTIEECIPTWADFEMKLAEYAHVFKDESELMACLQDYADYLNTYLSREQKEFFDVFEKNDLVTYKINQEMRQSLYSFFNGLTPNSIRAINTVLNNGQRRYNFVCFNYTNVFKHLVDQAFSRDQSNHELSSSRATSVIHIHGRLNSNVILGIDNEGQLTDLPYKLTRRGKRNIVKPFLIDEFDQKRKNDCINYINSSDVICVYGLELGDSDLTWRKGLADWLLKDSNHHLVYYNYSLATKKYSTISITQKMDDEEDFKDLLINKLFFGGIGNDQLAPLVNQIHIPTGVDIFNIISAIQDAKIEKEKRDNIRKSSANVAVPPIT